VHTPNDKNRAMVVALVTNGATHDRIAEHLAISPKTLRKHYAEQLDFGTENLLAAVLGNLASIATKGHGMAAVQAAKYLLSCRGGYREHAVLAFEPAAGLPGYIAESGKGAREIIEERLDVARRNAELAKLGPSSLN
jgi:predicted transcriptional regulator